MNTIFLFLVLLISQISESWAFAPLHTPNRRESRMQSSSTTVPTVDDINACKASIVQTCEKTPKPDRETIRSLVQNLEEKSEQIGIGQSSSLTGLLSGDWELLYSPEDATRSSPFFWAFRKAFPDSSDQIFGITDAIPAPIKEVGPAFQNIEYSENTQTGKFVSRVKVATLGGLATSIMTTRASIVGVEGLDGIRLRIESTKPEESTVLKMLGPLGAAVNENSPPFPSGEALERAQPGSSEVVLKTTFCDEGMRITRDGEHPNDIYVWRRSSFATFTGI